MVRISGDQALDEVSSDSTVNPSVLGDLRPSCELDRLTVGELGRKLQVLPDDSRILFPDPSVETLSELVKTLTRRGVPLSIARMAL